MILENSWKEYLANARAAIAFGLLLFFVPFLLLDFFASQNMFFSSGSFFIEYNIVNPAVFIVEFVLASIFLFFFAFFVSLIVFGVRKNLSKVRVEYYLAEMVRKFSVKIFVFFWLYMVAFFAFGFLAVTFMEPASGILLVSLALLALSLLFMFVPQAIVVDEVGIADAVRESAGFIAKNISSFLMVLGIGVALTAGVLLLEYALDFIALDVLPGRFVSVIILLVFVVPFLEVLKTYMYLMKFDLVKMSEMAHSGGFGKKHR
ncbi:MAG: hypothetical protein NT067_05905 [Candidatus Diapherotrites archaeon]|nr:hypothetical protein [Candidatus Diapherotrites archaeon]